MEITICPGKAPRRAAVPLSKSEGHRALILAAMAQGETLLPWLPASGDLLATMDCLRHAGAQLFFREKKLWLRGAKAPRFCGHRRPGGQNPAEEGLAPHR